jgi:hypothetical protein
MLHARRAAELHAPDGCILCPPGEYEKVSEELEQPAMGRSGADETLALSHGRDT